MRKFYWNTVVKKFLIGNVFLSTEQEDYSYECMWTMSNWQARQKTWNRRGKFSMKDVDLGEPTSFLDHVYLGWRVST